MFEFGRRPRHALAGLGAAGLGVILVLAASRGGAQGAADPHHDHLRHSADATMDDEAMKGLISAWYASHPEHGGTITGAAADTFLVGNFWFDTDGSLATQIDTAKIEPGESILFKWVAGFHTTTSGNPGDLDAGSLWDHAIDNLNSANLEFVVNFPDAGTFPFFCSPHGAAFDMKGVVLVEGGNVSVPPAAVATRVGFSRPPAPNPTRGGVSFEIRLDRPGRTAIHVFDASGRRVAVPLDASLGAGVHTGSWPGRDAAGAQVSAGVYYLRLTAPGVDQTRSVSIER